MIDNGLYLSALCIALPSLAAGWLGWALRGRVDSIGLPWALLPMGSRLKRLWENEGR